MKKFSVVLICLVFLLFCAAAPAVSEMVNNADYELILPDSLLVIEQSAFEKTESISRVVVPEGVKRIESRAFAQSSLKEIVLPKSLEYMADDAFDGCTDWKPIVFANSYAHDWCVTNQVSYDFADEPVAELAAPVISEITTVELTGLKLSWSAVEGAVSYDIYRSTTGASDSFVKVGATSELSYTDSGLESGAEYWYYIQAQTANGIVSEASAVVNAKTDTVEYRALLIGNTYPGTSNELPGPDNDIAAMARMLQLQTATPYTVVAKQDVTVAQIQSAITQAYADADSTDVSLFYYSGHGTSSGHLCGTQSTYLSSQTLRSCLDQIPGTKIVLLDCCFSGYHINKSSGDTQMDEAFFNQAVISAFSAKTRSYLAADQYIVLTACSKTQNSVSAGIYKNGQPFYFGAFTYVLAKGSGFNMLNDSSTSLWADHAGDGNNQITLGEAFNYVVDKIKNELDFEQDTQYYGDTAYVLWSQK